jgi:hypothetical protein
LVEDGGGVVARGFSLGEHGGECAYYCLPDSGSYVPQYSSRLVLFLTMVLSYRRGVVRREGREALRTRRKP